LVLSLWGRWLGKTAWFNQSSTILLHHHHHHHKWVSINVSFVNLRDNAYYI
jgi:hypothetical protein